MTLEEIKAALQVNNFQIKQEDRNENDTGTQLRLTNGAIVNVYDTGNLNVQGKNTEEVKAALGTAPQGTAQAAVSRPNNKVFVVYGHDKAARDNLEAMLRRLGPGTSHTWPVAL